jgi:hypothetical protein
MPEIAQLIDAKEGYNAVIVNLESGKPVFFPVVVWGLVEEEGEEPVRDGGNGPEIGHMIQQGVIPLICAPDRKAQTLQPAYLYDGFIGISSPGDKIENWNEDADEFLAMKAAGMLEGVEPRAWN